MPKFKITQEITPDNKAEYTIEADDEDDARQKARAEYGGYTTHIENLDEQEDTESTEKNETAGLQPVREENLDEPEDVNIDANQDQASGVQTAAQSQGTEPRPVGSAVTGETPTAPVGASESTVGPGAESQNDKLAQAQDQPDASAPASHRGPLDAAGSSGQ